VSDPVLAPSSDLVSATSGFHNFSNSRDYAREIATDSQAILSTLPEYADRKDQCHVGQVILRF